MRIMWLKKWKSYLTQNNFTNFDTHNSHLDGLTDFFSFINTLDSFNVKFLNSISQNIQIF
jgi:hypothetical protein